MAHVTGLKIGSGRSHLSDRARFNRACLVGGAVAMAAFAWMVTGGTFDFLGRYQFSDFYDVQARALLHGHWDMPASVLSIEGIRIGARTYMYYGPVPALLRIPVLLLTHRLDGRLTSISLLVAFALALFFVTRLSWKIRVLVRGTEVVGRSEAAWAGAYVAVAGMGSVLFFLASRVVIYHEAELWGATLALGAFDSLVGFLVRPSRGGLAWAGVLATMAILTRGSVGAGPVLAIGLVLAVHLVRWRRGSHKADQQLDEPGEVQAGDHRRTRWLVGLALASIVPVVAYVAINYVKFHTLFSLPLDKQVFTSLSPSRRAALAGNGGSLFGAKFIPTGLLAYLRPDALSVGRLFPFLGFPGSATVLGHVRYDTLDFASSASDTMPVLVLLGMGGVAATFWPRRSGRLSVLRIPMIGAGFATLGVFTIAYVANRYLADFMPLVILASLVGFQLLMAHLSKIKSESANRATPRALSAVRMGAFVGLTALALFGVWVNLSLGLLYQRQLSPTVPQPVRAGFVSFQESVDHDLFGNPPTGVRSGSTLPSPGPAGQLFIVDSCEGLYQSNTNDWEAVERDNAAGHYRLRLSFPDAPAGARQPLLVSGSPGQGDFLAVHFLGGGNVAFSYLFQSPGAKWFDGPSFPIQAGRTYTVDAVMDTRIHQISAAVDGHSRFDITYYLSSTPKISVGIRPIPGPTTARFGGQIRSEPVTTPICDRLVKRFEAHHVLVGEQVGSQRHQ